MAHGTWHITHSLDVVVPYNALPIDVVICSPVFLINILRGLPVGDTSPPLVVVAVPIIPR